MRDLEAELEAEQRRTREAQGSLRRVERQYKEVLVVYEDDRRQIAELQDLVDKLSMKIKLYKRQLEEAVS